MLDRIFQLEAAGSNLRTEVVAGTTTFMTMCYILVVNPQILGRAGMPFDGVLFATCVAGGIGTLVMGLVARYPVALAPGMGLNAYFAFVVAPQLVAPGQGPQSGWQAALGAVFISGLLFLVLALVRARHVIIDGIPNTLKLAIAGGIGMFIALIGFQNGGLVRADPATMLAIGNLRSPPPLLTIAGLLGIGGLAARGVKGAVFVGIILLTAAALALGLTSPPTEIVAIPNPGGTWLQLDIPGALRAGVLNVIFAFFFVDLFDTIGTLVGVATQGGLLDQQGRLPRASHALFADAVGTMLGALLGTSTVTSYIESGAGIAAGGRTGLSAVVTGLLLLSATLFAPLFRIVPPVATAPVLIIVGALMTSHVRQINWADLTDAIPAFLTLIGIAFTFSIADGMALGFIAHAVVKALAGRRREVSWVGWLLALLFVARHALVSG